MSLANGLSIFCSKLQKPIAHGFTAARQPVELRDDDFSRRLHIRMYQKRCSLSLRKYSFHWFLYLLPRSLVHCYLSKSWLGPRRLGRLRPTDCLRFRLKSSTPGFNASFCIASYRDRSLSISRCFPAWSCRSRTRRSCNPRRSSRCPNIRASFSVRSRIKTRYVSGLVLCLDASTPP